MYKKGEKIFDKQFPGETVTYKEKLIELVNQKLSGHQIAEKMGINYTTVHRWLRKLQLSLPNFHNELKFDNTVFDVIDTEEKAYWLGFLYADGYISTDRASIELSLMGSDSGHLEKFRNFLQYKTSIKMGIATCKGKQFSRCRLNLVNEHFHNRLITLGCMPKKSLQLSFPDTSIFANEDLVFPFIRGYFDGDGCVTHTANNELEMIIVGTKEMMNGIKLWCPNIFGWAMHKDKRHPDSNTYTLVCTCHKATTFGHLLYDNATIYLQRKYDKFNELKHD